MRAEVARRVARISSVEFLGVGIGRVDLHGDGVGIGVRPGRFAMVEAPGREDCVLLRPFSYFLAPSTDQIALLIKDVGKGTHALLSANRGTEVSIVGPLGNAFPEPLGPCWIVAGGVGAAPWGGMLGHPEVRVYFGARTAEEAGFAEALRAAGGRVEVATDDGSDGYAGTVTELLSERLREDTPTAIYTCGPTPMMAEVARLSSARGVACWVSLEERMGCGFGVCRGCAHPFADGNWRCICEDGPVYHAQEVFGR
jgi:dihydroorotate dehydrogenase electron transfer subunit